MRVKITNYIHIRNPYLCKKQDRVHKRFPLPFAVWNSGYCLAGSGFVDTCVPFYPHGAPAG